MRLNLTIPRYAFRFIHLDVIDTSKSSDFIRTTMTGLVGPFPSERRKPGRGKGPKQRSAANAIGIFQEIHADGHEKLAEKALRMGPGIGISGRTYACVGWTLAITVPNN
ncbi:hypothetical protein B0H14DRAFT_2396199 [Mycena olivaceomarginata]|nr:hypothetical protein B0H14DRAFT_2396199 [Mycena olivaceomarginata]